MNYKFYLIVAALVLFVYFVVFPDKAEFQRFAEISTSYALPLMVAVLAAPMAAILYSRRAELDEAHSKRLIDIGVWISSAIAFVAVTALVLLVKLSADYAS
ncbi:hypothetical protein G6N76_09360 [Rhizobium daejeonense]|uniref:Uncharacterized protein n=1 Tax=Rhizobium daejeonense TaxID=240521 RepID=A0A6M1RRD0_9HYPH|nr:hypothetical protein [Rhizobium daejeonense]NGO63882.1 hypothetical protein [Rhizobium daejeonense]